MTMIREPSSAHQHLKIFGLAAHLKAHAPRTRGAASRILQVERIPSEEPAQDLSSTAIRNMEEVLIEFEPGGNETIESRPIGVSMVVRKTFSVLPLKKR